MLYFFIITERVQSSTHRRQVRQHPSGAPAPPERGWPERTGKERSDPTARCHPLQPRQCGSVAAREGSIAALHRQGEWRTDLVLAYFFPIYMFLNLYFVLLSSFFSLENQSFCFILLYVHTCERGSGPGFNGVSIQFYYYYRYLYNRF